MSAKDVKKYCRLDTASAELLNQSITRLGLSARAYHRILKIALTIADLAEAEVPTVAHVAEAVQYRRMQYEL
jgi:magnesium chelatase family protein